MLQVYERQLLHMCWNEPALLTQGGAAQLLHELEAVCVDAEEAAFLAQMKARLDEGVESSMLWERKSGRDRDERFE